MATNKSSPLLILLILPALFLVSINPATADLNVPDIPQEFQEFDVLKDDVVKSKIIEQIDGKGKEAANAPKSADASTLANMLNSAPAPDGKGKLNKIMEQFNGPAPQAAALKSGGDDSFLYKMFKSARGPDGDGGDAAAVDIITKMINKRSPAPDTAVQDQVAPPPPESSGSPTQIPSTSSIVGVGMVAGFVSFFMVM